MKPIYNHYIEQAHVIGVRDFTGYTDQLDQCLQLTIGEPDADTDPAIIQATMEALNNHETHYAPAMGYPDLRAKISELEARIHQVHFTPDEVMITQGSTEGISAVLFSLLNPGDEVIVPLPAYALYRSIIEMAGARMITVDTTDDDFQLTTEKLANVISDKTRILLITSPNNPTGTVQSRQTLDRLHDYLRDKPQIILLLDEIYSRLIYTEYASLAQYDDLHERTIVAQSFSKSHAMTGWRVGYLLVGAPLVDIVLKWHHNVMVGVTSFIQSAARKALEIPVDEAVERYRARRDYLVDRLKDMGIPVVLPEGAFYVFPDIRAYEEDSVTFCRKLAEQEKLALVPGVYFGGEGHVRISYCRSLDEIKDGMDRLERFLKSY